jgi:hypothetical protein
MSTGLSSLVTYVRFNAYSGVCDFCKTYKHGAPRRICDDTSFRFEKLNLIIVLQLNAYTSRNISKLCDKNVN